MESFLKGFYEWRKEMAAKTIKAQNAGCTLAISNAISIMRWTHNIFELYCIYNICIYVWRSKKTTFN